MTTALIFAGGTGIRMNTRARPKQFLELHGKPIIVYTIEHFNFHREIDNCIVVCLSGWMRELHHLLKQYALEKVSKVVVGGDRIDISIYNGLQALEGICSADDIVLIHDGVRPMISSELISKSIATAKEYGTAITVEPVTESVVRLNGHGQVTDIPPRWEMYHAKAPQTFRYGMIWDMYKRAREDGKIPVDSAHLCGMYDVNMHTVTSTPNNIKITSPADYYIFRALYEAIENEQILGI